jgi:hypothetical protein
MEPNHLIEAFLIHIVKEKLDFNIRNDFDLTVKRNKTANLEEFCEISRKKEQLFGINRGQQEGRDFGW